MATGVMRYAVAQSLNAGGAGLGGGTSGCTDGVLNWDSTKTVSANLEHIAELTGSAALRSAFMGAAVSGGTVALTSNLPSIKSRFKSLFLPAAPPPDVPPALPPLNRPAADVVSETTASETTAPETKAPENKAPENKAPEITAQGSKAPEVTPTEVTAPAAKPASAHLPQTSTNPEETFEPEVRGRSIEGGDNPASTTPPRAELSEPRLTDTEIGANLRQQIKDVTQTWHSADTITPAELEARRLQLEEAINKFQDKENLPHIKLAIDDDFKSGEGAYGDGVIRIGDQDISKPGEALNVSLGHELTHAEQDYLKICQAADRLNIGKVATKEEALELAKELKTLDDDYVNNNTFALLPFAEDALVKRNGVPLNAAENMRADLLSKAAASYPRSDGRWDLIHDHLKTLQQKTALEEAQTLDYYQSSSFMSTNIKKLLGTETPSPEVQELIDKARAIEDGVKPKSPWSEHDAQGILSRVYRAEMLKAQDEQNRAWQEYQDNLLEKEAMASERNLREPRDIGADIGKLFRLFNISS